MQPAVPLRWITALTSSVHSVGYSLANAQRIDGHLGTNWRGWTAGMR
jgi:hypothetical protein